MSLENFAHYNDISPKLREILEEKVRSYGRSVRYKFEISKPNPDPSKYNGDTVYPNMYTLDPSKFTIIDPYEDRPGKSKTKNIALIDDRFLNDQGIPERFKKVRVKGSDKSILRLMIEDNIDDFYMAMFLELHPKFKGGQFMSRATNQVFSRIDETAAAKEARSERSERLKALNAAQSMSDDELINFADAMQWDSTESFEVLRNKVEELADTNPIYFNDLVKGKSIEYQSLIKQAVDRSIIAFDASEYKFVWATNNQPIVVLSPVTGKNEIQKMSEWMQTNGVKGEELYKKLKSLIRGGKKEKAPLSE
jgi:hypothetical protein